MSDLIRPCPLCGQQCKRHPGVGDRNDSHHWIDCNTCGSYGITKSALLTGVLTADIKPLLSAIARRRYEEGDYADPITITTENYKNLISSAPEKTDISAKTRYLLRYIAHKSRFPGDKITLNGQTNYPICFAANTNEFGFYIQHIKEAGFVDEHSSAEHAHHQYSLTPKGWEESHKPADPVLDSVSSSSTTDTEAKPEAGVSVPQAVAQVRPLDAPADVRPSAESAKRPKVFVCYRRVDSEYPAQFIHDKLASHFGDDAVFFDVDSIPLGRDFHGILNEAVGRCDVLLAVIGDQWLTLKNAAGQRRIDDPDDFVRIEIEAALQRQISVIPVLVGRASVPGPEDLPPTLRGLARRQATEMRPGRDFPTHLDRLVRDVEQAMNVAEQQNLEHVSQLTASLSRPLPGQPPTPASPIPPCDASQLVVADSGRWLLLDTKFYEGDTVRQTATGEWVAEIQSTGAEDDAYLGGLKPQHFARSRPIAFAHRNDGFLAAVKSVESVSRGGQQVWIVSMIPEDIHYGMDMAYQATGKLYTPDDFARLRAGRILLNDPPPLKDDHRSAFDRTNEIMLESFIRGSNNPVSVERCIVQVIYQGFKGDSERFLRLARLASIYFLKAGNVAEQILDLTLGPIREGKVHVRFRGRRRQAPSNVELVVIETEGECPLG